MIQSISFIKSKIGARENGKNMVGFKKKKYSMYENKIVRNLRDGKVTKEELDKCSTCDMCLRADDQNK